MGLDVSLYRIPNFDDVMRREKIYEEELEKLYENEDLTYEDRKKLSDGLLSAYGLVDWGTAAEREKIELDSSIDPGHLFKIGYFRSSYNAGGINHKLQDTIGYGLEEIAGFVSEEEYIFSPDWKQVKKNAEKAIFDLQHWLEVNGSFTTYEVHFNPFMSLPDVDNAQALKVFHNEFENNKNRKKDTFWSGNYSNIHGDFCPNDPMKVYGFVMGKSSLGSPAVFAIIDGDYDWYVTALKIMVETAQYVLDTKNSSEYYLSWSG